MPSSPRRDASELDATWAWVSVAAAAIFLGLDAAIWTYVGWESVQPGAGSVGSGIVFFPLLGLMAASWTFVDGYRQQQPWRSVLWRSSLITVALSAANAVYDQGSWLSDSQSSLPLNFAAYLVGLVMTLGAPAVLGCAFGAGARSIRDRRR